MQTLTASSAGENRIISSNSSGASSFLVCESRGLRWNLSVRGVMLEIKSESQKRSRGTDPQHVRPLKSQALSISSPETPTIVQSKHKRTYGASTNRVSQSQCRISVHYQLSLKRLLIPTQLSPSPSLPLRYGRAPARLRRQIHALHQRHPL
jgi:hypothetical protein